MNSVQDGAGHLLFVKYLVDRDEQVLRRSATQGRFDVVKILVARGADIHARDDEAFRETSLLGHLDIVRFLVGRGADIHARDDEALRTSCYFGHTDVVRFLVNTMMIRAGVGFDLEAMNEIVCGGMKHPIIVDILCRGDIHATVRREISQRLVEWDAVLLFVRLGMIPPEIGLEISRRL